MIYLIVFAIVALLCFGGYKLYQKRKAATAAPSDNLTALFAGDVVKTLAPVAIAASSLPAPAPSHPAPAAAEAPKPTLTELMIAAERANAAAVNAAPGVAAVSKPAAPWSLPDISSQATIVTLYANQEFVIAYAPGPAIHQAEPGHYSTAGSDSDASVTCWVTDSAGNIAPPGKKVSGSEFDNILHPVTLGMVYSFHIVSTKTEKRTLELKLIAAQ